MSDDFRKMGFQTSKLKETSKKQTPSKPMFTAGPTRPHKPTEPELWEEVKDKYRATSDGSEPGQWSARKSVRAQMEYARRGGDFVEIEGPPVPPR